MATVETVEAFSVTLPLPRPLRLGAQTVSHRAYCVVRLGTSDGIVGNAYALSRDLPVAEMINGMLGTLLVGQQADDISAIWDRLYRGTLFGGRTGGLMRALSLIDIALWDIKGKRAGLPVWRLLGGGGPDVPCMYIAAYPTGESPVVLGERVAAASQDGHSLLKVARLPNPSDLATLLRTATSSLAGTSQIVVDAAWCWRGAREAADEIQMWGGEAPLAWVEDPLIPEDTEGYARLVRSGVARIGVGDDFTDRFGAKALMLHAGVDVLRIDACAVGGITAAWALSHVADALGVRVSYHVYPETHVHLAAASSADSLVETFGAADNPYDPSATLYTGGPAFRPGWARANERPGLGFDINAGILAARPPRRLQ
ncbi:enolase C-terminal domain-like protein [Nonomuraea antimicrobica]|uniref:Enolase C-terminal domain-like protein n=1 Tax=Nonomuraea antimicrobica TaxID=561173 RepID=A0ABP7D5M2_9ACTN